MISKELLRAVLGVKVEYIRLIDIYDGRLDARANDLHITFEEYVENINIYEIAHKCKEWAYYKGYIINTALEPLTHKESWQYDLFKLRYEKIDMVMDIPPTQHFIITKSYDTEPEAIFKACEWIFKEMKK